MTAARRLKGVDWIVLRPPFLRARGRHIYMREESILLGVEPISKLPRGEWRAALMKRKYRLGTVRVAKYDEPVMSAMIKKDTYNFRLSPC